MCLLLLNKAHAPEISADQFKTAWGNNPHGGGLVYTDSTGKMVVRKTQKSWAWFYKIYLDAKAEAPDSHFIVHFRWATHGPKNTENTHPFKVWDGLYFAHNGVLRNYGDHDTKSDTRDFNERILHAMPDDFYMNPDFIRLLSEHIGTNNKMVFLDADNNYSILNEKSGTWISGNWYSNGSHVPTPSYSYTRSHHSDEPTKKMRAKDKKIYSKPSPQNMTGDAKKMEAKFQAWRTLLDRTIKAGGTTPDYGAFSKDWEATYATNHGTTQGEIGWLPAATIDM